MDVQIFEVLSSIYLLERTRKCIRILGFIIALFKNNWLGRKEGRKKERKKERESTQKPSENWKTVKSKVVSIHAMKANRERKSTAPLILKLGARCRWVVSITPRPLYITERTPILIEAGWASESIWTFWRRNISCPCRDLKPRPSSP
jgi:hypothetical protein